MDSMTVGIDVLEKIKRSCERSNLSGTAAVVVLYQDQLEKVRSMTPKLFFTPMIWVIGEAFQPPNKEKYGDDDPGGNLPAIALSKVMEMVRTGKNSGTATPMVGEVGFVGGYYEHKGPYHIFAAFSGLSSEEDLELVQNSVKNLHVG